MTTETAGSKPTTGSGSDLEKKRVWYVMIMSENKMGPDMNLHHQQVRKFHPTVPARLVRALSALIISSF